MSNCQKLVNDILSASAFVYILWILEVSAGHIKLSSAWYKFGYPVAVLLSVILHLFEADIARFSRMECVICLRYSGVQLVNCSA